MGILYFTNISKQNISDNRVMSGWHSDDVFVNIYKIEKNSNKKDADLDFSIIRFGTDCQGNTYFWNGRIYHRIISQALNLPWVAAYVYGLGEVSLMLSRAYKIEAEEFRKYLENDEIIRSSVEDIINIYPKIRRIDVNGSKISIPVI